MKDVPLIDVKAREGGRQELCAHEGGGGIARRTASKFVRDRKREETAEKERGKGCWKRMSTDGSGPGEGRAIGRRISAKLEKRVEKYFVLRTVLRITV